MTIRNRCCRYLFAFVAVATMRCTWDAPRDNPLDPTLGGNISGRVLTRRATPLAGAAISMPEAGRAMETDSAGRFELHGLPDESAWVFASAPGYEAESVRVELAKGVIDTLTFYLNGLPYLENCQVASHVYSRGWPPEPLQFCTLTASAGDVDGVSDLDSVWVEIPAIARTTRLPYDSDRKLYVHTLWEDELPGKSLEALVGRQVAFKVADLESAEVTVTSAGINRIITVAPTPVFPSGGLDTLSSDTVFSWHRFDYGYAVQYHGELVRIEGGSPAGVAATFDAEDTTWQFDSSLLATGDYYWTIEAIDDFGNSSRSAEEVFHAR